MHAYIVVINMVHFIEKEILVLKICKGRHRHYFKVVPVCLYSVLTYHICHYLSQAFDLP